MSFLIQTIRWLNLGGLTLSAIAMLVMMLHITLEVGILHWAMSKTATKTSGSICLPR